MGHLNVLYKIWKDLEKAWLIFFSINFRYRCEGRSAGTLHGVSTTGRYSEIKTFPKVKIHGFQVRKYLNSNKG